MTEADWESLEEDILELLSETGVSAIAEDAEDITIRFIRAIRKSYAEGCEDDNDND